jgi:hypothetical protein
MADDFSIDTPDNASKAASRDKQKRMLIMFRGFGVLAFPCSLA